MMMMSCNIKQLGNNFRWSNEIRHAKIEAVEYPVELGDSLISPLLQGIQLRYTLINGFIFTPISQEYTMKISPRTNRTSLHISKPQISIPYQGLGK
jgi:hypothetical protein